MTPNLKDQLIQLAEALHLHKGDNEDKATEVAAAINDSLTNDDHHSLRERIELAAIDFEDDHPELAGRMRAIVDSLAAYGL